MSLERNIVGNAVQTINTLTSQYNHRLNPYELVGISVYRELERRHTIHLDNERVAMDELMTMIFDRLMARSFRLLEEIVSFDASPEIELQTFSPAPVERVHSPPSKTINVEEECDCSICLSTIGKNETVYDIPCSHIFHKHCLNTWIKRKNTCPLCRQKIRSTEL